VSDSIKKNPPKVVFGSQTL